MTSPIRVLCVDDHPIVREGIGAVLRLETDMLLVGYATNAESAIQIFCSTAPDVTLMDLHFPDGDGISVIRQIRAVKPNARVIALTTYSTEAHIRGAIDAGVSGYLLKESLRCEMVNAIRAVHCGLRWIPREIEVRLAESQMYEPLTLRELDVLRLMAEGMRNRSISEALSVAEETVKAHVRNILAKLRAQDRTQAVTVAVRRGILELGERDGWLV